MVIFLARSAPCQEVVFRFLGVHFRKVHSLGGMVSVHPTVDLLGRILDKITRLVLLGQRPDFPNQRLADTVGRIVQKKVVRFRGPVRRKQVIQDPQRVFRGLRTGPNVINGMVIQHQEIDSC